MSYALSPAKLDAAALAEIRKLESEIDSVLVALDPTPALAKLSPEELTKLKDAEERLGVVMLAYDT